MTAAASTQDRAAGGTYRVHGGDHPQVAGMLDLSVNVSPLGPTRAVLAAIRDADLSRYPDPRAGHARGVVAECFGTRPAGVALGNGAAELLWLTCRTLLCRPGARVLLQVPTFSEWEAAAVACGATVHRLALDETRDFAWNPDAFDRALTCVQPAMAYLCAPNNPTGTGVPIADVGWLAARHPRVVFVVDQAFLSLSPRAAELCQLPPDNGILIRSLTKEHRLPGLRVGYALAAPPVIERLERGRPAWSSGAPVQAAVAAAMAEGAHVAGVREHMLADARRTRAVLDARGIRALSGEAPFVLAQVPHAGRFSRELAALGVLVRDCTSFGLARHVRLAGVGLSDGPRLAAALDQVLERAPHVPPQEASS